MAGGITAAVIGGAAVLGGAYMSSQGQQNAAQTQADAARAQQQNLLAAGQTASQQFTPYADYGKTSLSSLISNNPYFNQQFSNQDLNANLAPNYAFGLQQGMTGAAQQANASGGLIGGNAQQALNTFGQNYAQNAYQNAFNNFQTQRGNISALDLANANLGLAGATGSANAQLGTATNIANIGIGAANAQAASQIAQGNIAGGAANSIGSIGYGYFNGLPNQSLNNQNLGGYTPSEIAQGATPGVMTPTAGNSFTVNPA